MNETVWIPILMDGPALLIVLGYYLWTRWDLNRRKCWSCSSRRTKHKPGCVVLRLYSTYPYYFGSLDSMPSDDWVSQSPGRDFP